MNQGQLDALIAALQGGGGGRRKVSPYSDATASTWMTWKAAFIQTALVNNWNDLRQRREASASMEGTAGKLTRDINPNPDVADGAPAFTINDLFALYENQFMPPQESDLAVSAFESATQDADETPILWAARVKELYLRAYPGAGVNDRNLINRFTLGLSDREVATYVHEHRPATYEAASQAAQTKTASKQFLYSQWRGGGGGTKGGRGGSGRNSLQSVEGRNEGRGRIRCYFCGRNGHAQRNCDKYKKSQGIARTEVRNNNGNNNNNNRNKKKGEPTVAVTHIDAGKTDEAASDDHQLNL